MWQGFVLDTHGYYGTFSQLSYPWAVNGDVNMTISDMVTTSSAIGVAAYNSKPVYKAIDGANYSYPGYQKGRIALFSSLGPTADGRKKPDIAGPGLALASSINSLDTTYYSNGSDYTSVVSNFVSPQNGATYAYAVAAGTSMSCPAVSGIIALLLEINHYLKPADVLQILSQTAIKDVYTTATPNGNIWGAGKVNAYKAIKSTLTFNGITHVGQSNQNVLVYPNPSNGNYKVFLESDKSSQLVLTDISGNICLVKNIVGGNQGSTIDLDVQQFASGTYLLQIKNDSGNEFVKLVKQ
jgi:subtilisin family serine protease